MFVHMDAVIHTQGLSNLLRAIVEKEEMEFWEELAGMALTFTRGVK